MFAASGEFFFSFTIFELGNREKKKRVWVVERETLFEASVFIQTLNRLRILWWGFYFFSSNSWLQIYNFFLFKRKNFQCCMKHFKIFAKNALNISESDFKRHRMGKFSERYAVIWFARSEKDEMKRNKWSSCRNVLDVS